MKLLRRKNSEPDFDAENPGDIITIIEDLKKPSPWDGTDWHAPVRQDRPALHVTGPQRRMLPAPPRPPLGRLLKLWKADLPVFRRTVKEKGHRGLLPVPAMKDEDGRLMMDFDQAIYAIAIYSDKTNAMICSQYQAARAEVAEGIREARERVFRRRPPLSGR